MMKIGDDVVRTKITHRPEPDHAARQLGALSGNDRAITVVHVAHYRRAVEPVRETKDGHGGRQWTRGLEHRQASASHPACNAADRRRCRASTFGRHSSSIMARASRSATTKDTGGLNGVSPLSREAFALRKSK